MFVKYSDRNLLAVILDEAWTRETHTSSTKPLPRSHFVLNKKIMYAIWNFAPHLNSSNFQVCNLKAWQKVILTFIKRETDGWGAFKSWKRKTDEDFIDWKSF